MTYHLNVKIVFFESFIILKKKAIKKKFKFKDIYKR